MLYEFPLMPTFVRRLLNPLYLKLASLEMKFTREQALDEGITWDYLHESGNDIRRDPFHENFVRQMMHPYHYLMYIWERHPTSKVDFHIPGFEAPDYLREPARKRTYHEAKDKIDLFYMAINNNFKAENTPLFNIGVGSYVVLEGFYIHNFFSRAAWNRYFFNEKTYYTKEQYL